MTRLSCQHTLLKKKKLFLECKTNTLPDEI